jgi:hypothetical protein
MFIEPHEWKVRYDENAYCSLVRTGPSNLKYTHHPVTAAQELSKDLSLRHLSFEALTNGIREYGRTRTNCWYIRDNIESLAIQLPETAKTLSLVFGTKCICCDNMAWNGISTSELDSETYCKEYDKFREIVRNQSDYVMVLKREYFGLYTGVPVLCSECLKTARTAKPHPVRVWNYNDTNVLRGMIALLEKEIEKKFGIQLSTLTHRKKKPKRVNLT